MSLKKVEIDTDNFLYNILMPIFADNDCRPMISDIPIAHFSYFYNSYTYIHF